MIIIVIIIITIATTTTVIIIIITFLNFYFISGQQLWKSFSAVSTPTAKASTTWTELGMFAPQTDIYDWFLGRYSK